MTLKLLRYPNQRGIKICTTKTNIMKIFYDNGNISCGIKNFTTKFHDKALQHAVCRSACLADTTLMLDNYF